MGVDDDQAPEKEYLTEDEARDELRGLSLSDYARLLAFTKSKFGYKSDKCNDFIQEAALRIWEGDRKIPKNQPFLVSMMHIIRSINSSDSRDAEKENKECLNDNIVDNSIFGISPERQVSANLDLRSVLQELEEKLKNDGIAKEILSGRLNGESANDVQHRTGVSFSQFEAGRRRLERMIRKLTGDRR